MAPLALWETLDHQVMGIQDCLVPKVTQVLRDAKDYQDLQVPQVVTFQDQRGHPDLKEIRGFPGHQGFLDDQALQAKQRHAAKTMRLALLVVRVNQVHQEFQVHLEERDRRELLDSQALKA